MYMKLLLTFLLSFSSFNESSINYTCSSYIVYDGANNKVLEGNNIDGRRSVASISKVLSAILVIEYGFLDEYITIGDWINKVDGSSVYLYVGEVISVRELLYGLMLRSGNDCAMSLAMYVSGNVSSFVDKMNLKAKEIGMTNSEFRNPSGLDSSDGGNISTVYDMALLMAYAMRNETFREVVSTQSYKSTNHGVWKNKNKLLSMYEYAIGGKTGYTSIAKRTLVSVARCDDTELIVVTFNCGNDFVYHKVLYEYWFDRYRVYLVINKGVNYIDKYVVYCDDDIYITSSSDNKIIVNYHLIPSLSKMEISTSESDKIVGECQIKKENDKEKSKSFFDKLLDKLKEWF